jgi:hypothetical protein
MPWLSDSISFGCCLEQNPAIPKKIAIPMKSMGFWVCGKLLSRVFMSFVQIIIVVWFRQIARRFWKNLFGKIHLITLLLGVALQSMNINWIGL